MPKSARNPKSQARPPCAWACWLPCARLAYLPLWRRKNCVRGCSPWSPGLVPLSASQRAPRIPIELAESSVEEFPQRSTRRVTSILVPSAPATQNPERSVECRSWQRVPPSCPTLKIFPQGARPISPSIPSMPTPLESRGGGSSDKSVRRSIRKESAGALPHPSADRSKYHGLAVAFFNVQLCSSSP